MAAYWLGKSGVMAGEVDSTCAGIWLGPTVGAPVAGKAVAPMGVAGKAVARPGPAVAVSVLLVRPGLEDLVHAEHQAQHVAVAPAERDLLDSGHEVLDQRHRDGHFTASRPLDLVRELPRHHARARRRGVVGEDSQPTDLHVARRYPRLVAHESQQRLLKTGGRLIRHARYFTLQLAETYLTGALFRQILARIEGLAWHPT